jgi:hypothetical protein
MGGSTLRYRDRFDRETTAVAWRAPDGRQFLICGTDSGFALRSPEEWESDDSVDFEADAEGNVYCDGEPVGWKIPAEILRRTTS